MSLTPTTIGIMSPSSSIVPERFDAGVRLLEAQGFHLVIHPQTYLGSGSGNQQAGTPAQKAQALHDLWNNPAVNLVMASCGGNRSSQLLPLLDYKIAKPVMGLSDTTALLSALYVHKVKGYFGPAVQNLARLNADFQEITFDILRGHPRQSISLPNITLYCEGAVRAPVFAATLSVLMSLAGTPYFPDLRGHILVVEDVGEELTHLDRALWHLRHCCDLTLLAGLIFGEFVDTRDTGRPFGCSLEDIIRTHIADLSCPIIGNAPIGHGAHLFPIRLGGYMTLDTASPHLILE